MLPTSMCPNLSRWFCRPPSLEVREELQPELREQRSLGLHFYFSAAVRIKASAISFFLMMNILTWQFLVSSYSTVQCNLIVVEPNLTEADHIRFVL